MMRSRTIWWYLFAAAVLASTPALAIPPLISYQGVLNDAGGVPVSGSVAFIFSIYDVPTGGTALWSEPQALSVSNGVFNVKLGAVTPLPSSLFFKDDLYLGIMVGSDSEMLPRQRLTSSAFAYRAESSDKLSFQNNVMIGRKGTILVHVPVLGPRPARSVRLYLFGRKAGATTNYVNHGVGEHTHKMVTGNSEAGGLGGYSTYTVFEPANMIEIIYRNGSNVTKDQLFGTYKTSVTSAANLIVEDTNVPQAVEIWIDGAEVTPAIGDPNSRGATMFDSVNGDWGIDGSSEWSSGAIDLTGLISWTVGDHFIEIKETGNTGGTLVYTLLVNH